MGPIINPLFGAVVIWQLINFTQANVRQFYSSGGELLAICQIKGQKLFHFKTVLVKNYLDARYRPFVNDVLIKLLLQQHVFKNPSQKSDQLSLCHPHAGCWWHSGSARVSHHCD